MIVLIIISILILILIFLNKSDYVPPQVLPDIITDEELDYILKQSSNIFVESTVLGDNPLNKKLRNSQTAWLKKTDPVVKGVIEKVCKKTGKKIENCEDLQVVKYEPSGFYTEHHDACCEDTELCKKFTEGIGQRVRTCVIYLTDNFEGGATKFPNLNLEIKPPKKSGVLFHPLDKKEEKCHDNALHAGTPVTSGIKMIANIWIRKNKYPHVDEGQGV